MSKVSILINTTLASMVLCLICWGAYAGVKKVNEKMVERKEKKRLKNESEGVVPVVVNAQSEKAALIARQQQLSSSSEVAQCTCDHANPQHARCDACKAEMEKEMEKQGEAPPAYYEVASGSNATTAVARA